MMTNERRNKNIDEDIEYKREDIELEKKRQRQDKVEEYQRELDDLLREKENGCHITWCEALQELKKIFCK